MNDDSLINKIKDNYPNRSEFHDADFSIRISSSGEITIYHNECDIETTVDQLNGFIFMIEDLMYFTDIGIYNAVLFKKDIQFEDKWGINIYPDLF